MNMVCINRINEIYTLCVVANQSESRIPNFWFMLGVDWHCPLHSAYCALNCVRCLCANVCVAVALPDPFFCWVNPFLLYLFVTFKGRFLLQNILSYLCFCCVRIWLINLHLRLLLQLDKPMHLHWILMLVQCTRPLGHWTHQNPARVHWTCPISLAKVNVHLLTS